MLLAPLSEYFGRRPVYIYSWFILFIFQLPLALAPNIGTVIVCRLIQGFGGSAPLSNTGGTISDLWERNNSGYAMLIYGLSSTFGPPFALVVCGYLGLIYGWRVLFWFFMAVTGVRKSRFEFLQKGCLLTVVIHVARLAHHRLHPP